LFKKLRPTIEFDDPFTFGLPTVMKISTHDYGGSILPPTETKAMMILIAGPYRSGTNDDPVLIHKNVELMESYALPIFRLGHIPVLGEWLALPLVALAGSKNIGDDGFNEIFHPIAVRLLEKCQAVLRVGGPSAGADEMVRVGSEFGLKIYKSVDDVPKL
jgi:GDP-mannose pyrophosphatase NudK